MDYTEAKAAVREYLDESAEGFWDDDELTLYLTHATSDLWGKLVVGERGPYVKHITFTSTGAQNYNLSVASITDFHEVLAILPSGSEVLPRWSIIKGASNVKIAFDSATTANFTLRYIHTPSNMGISTWSETSSGAAVIDVPEQYNSMIILHAVLLALQKAGHETADIQGQLDRQSKTMIPERGSRPTSVAVTQG